MVVLAAMMIYLFFNTANIKKHIDMHVEQAKNGIGIFAGIGAIYIIYLRESMEINTFIFMNTGDHINTKNHWSWHCCYNCCCRLFHY